MIESRRPETIRASFSSGSPAAPRLTAPERRLLDELLPGVSRTFAVTIPQLPGSLRQVVTTAYLLCRIADTIEDEAGLDAAEKEELLRRFSRVVCDGAHSGEFARDLSRRLAPATPPAERRLVERSAEVVRAAESFSPPVGKALRWCIRTMCGGMASFQASADPAGVPTLERSLLYCYFVAGVVGQTLTELFCLHSPSVAQNRESLMRLAVPFGQGLQMTNILKDVWTDRERGACWLPRDLFQSYGFDLSQLDPDRTSPPFQRALGEMIVVARSALEDAHRYVRLIPPREIGIRRFTLRTLFMALLTLRGIWTRRDFSNASQVKISRRMVRATISVTNIVAPFNVAIAGLVRVAAAGVPRTPRGEIARRALTHPPAPPSRPFKEWGDREPSLH